MEDQDDPHFTTIDGEAISADILSTSKLHKRLMNKAVHYLGRYQTSQQNLRRILRQFSKRKLDPDAPRKNKSPNQQANQQANQKASRAKSAPIYEPEAIEAAIQDIIELCAYYGYVDDGALANAKARSSVISGQSTYQLSGKLRLMGVDEDTTKQAIAMRRSSHSDPEKAAIIRAMRKKRLGPFCVNYQMLEFADQQKQVAKLARAGFSLDLIRSVLAIPTTHEAEEALYLADAPPQTTPE